MYSSGAFSEKGAGSLPSNRNIVGRRNGRGILFGGKRIKMARVDELAPGKMIEKRILARRVAVVNYKGEIHAFEGDCKHMKASLCKGTIENGVIVCPWHSWRYDLATGDCLTIDKVSLRKYDVEIENDDVYVIL